MIMMMIIGVIKMIKPIIASLKKCYQKRTSLSASTSTDGLFELKNKTILSKSVRQRPATKKNKIWRKKS